MVDQHSPDNRLRRVNSRQNTQVKELRRLFREASADVQGLIAVEGVHLLEEAIRSGLRVKTVFLSTSAQQRAHNLLPQLSSHTELLVLSDDVFASAVPTETPQGMAALLQLKSVGLEQLLAASPTLLVITAGVQDPGNLGTIARSAEAFGATGLLIGEKTVSPWNWKSVRASAGSLFRLAVVKVELAKVISVLRSEDIRVLATSSHQGTSITDIDFCRPVALIVGNEGSGISKELLVEADELIAISHSPRVESLNAGIAASIVLYEAARQRKNQPQRHRDTKEPNPR